MDLLGDLRALMSEREQHATAITMIDEQLSKARRALGVTPGMPSKPVKTRRPRWNGDGSLTKDRVIAALSLHQPQTRQQLAAAAHTTTLGSLLPQMVKAGELFVARSRNHDGATTKSAYLYALTPGALQRSEQADEEAALALEAESG